MKTFEARHVPADANPSLCYPELRIIHDAPILKEEPLRLESTESFFDRAEILSGYRDTRIPARPAPMPSFARIVAQPVMSHGYNPLGSSAVRGAVGIVAGFCLFFWFSIINTEKFSCWKKYSLDQMIDANCAAQVRYMRKDLRRVASTREEPASFFFTPAIPAKFPGPARAESLFTSPRTVLAKLEDLNARLLRKIALN